MQGNSKGKRHVRVVEFIVQDCPICGRKVARHFIEEEKKNENSSRQKNIR